MNKRFSVVIASYNREKYIRQTIDSVLSQTCGDYEIIVADDGSTDRTWEILQSYGDRIKSVRHENQGSEATFRRGASLATGQYLAFLDSDDLFMPGALALYETIIRRCAPPLLMASMIRFRDGQAVEQNQQPGESIEVLKYRDYFSKEISMGIAQSIIVMRRDIFNEINAVMDAYASARLFNYDYNLLLQAGTHGPCVIIKKPATVAYRQHENQNSLKVEKMAEGVLSMVKMVRSGKSFGGWLRFPDKCAYLGGPVYEWTRKAARSGQFALVFRLVLNGLPMMLFAAMKKLSFRFRRPTAPLVIKMDGSRELR